MPCPTTLQLFVYGAEAKIGIVEIAMVFSNLIFIDPAFIAVVRRRRDRSCRWICLHRNDYFGRRRSRYRCAGRSIQLRCTPLQASVAVSIVNTRAVLNVSYKHDRIYSC